MSPRSDEDTPPYTFPAVLPQSGEPGVVKHGRVFVIDDDPDIVESLRLALMSEPERYVVESAVDGAEAIYELLKRRHVEQRPAPDIIIVDLRLPYISGDDVAYLLQKSDLSFVPVLMISGAHPSDVRADMRDKFIFLRKPIDLEHLLSTISARVLEGRARARQPKF